MKVSEQEIRRFQNRIFSWWRKHRRDLPWRRTHDPYKIMISEVMLQQTQVSRVHPKYKEFLHEFPTIYDLANATTAKILRVWRGMGYNRRALYLKRAAEKIVREYGGKPPRSEKELRKLPGLGKYTARAILVFAYKQNIACVDTNIRNIIIHFFFNNVVQRESVIQEIAEKLMPQGKSWAWHHALMDYGALRMKKTKQMHPRKRTKETLPFKKSNRFIRGRIIDYLRTGRLREQVLLDHCIKAYGRDKPYFLSILEKLIAEGFIRRQGPSVGLSE